MNSTIAQNQSNDFNVVELITYCIAENLTQARSVNNLCDAVEILLKSLHRCGFISVYSFNFKFKDDVHMFSMPVEGVLPGDMFNVGRATYFVCSTRKTGDKRITEIISQNGYDLHCTVGVYVNSGAAGAPHCDQFVISC